MRLRPLTAAYTRFKSALGHPDKRHLREDTQTMYMNEYDLDFAVERFSNCALRRYRVACVVRALADWTDRNSDGWAYWPKPARAAKRLMELLSSADRWDPADVPESEVQRALIPVKAFLTRQGTTFEAMMSE